MGLREKIDKALLIDGRFVFPDSVDLSLVLLYTFMAAWFTKMAYSSRDILDFSRPSPKINIELYLYLPLIAAIVLFWLAAAYSHFAWLRQKKNNPDTEGPYFRKQVSLIRKWAICLGIFSSFIGLDKWGNKLIFSRPYSGGVITLIGGFLSAVIIAEMLRAIGKEKPWSSKKHIIVLAITYIFILSIQAAFFVHSDAYINFQYNLY